MYTEARGPSLKTSREKERADNVHHLRVYAHENSTVEAPKWLVEHHSTENDDRPAEYVFDEPKAMLHHIATYSGASGPQREIQPTALENEYGRSR